MSKERLEGEWFVSQRLWEGLPSFQNFMAHSPVRLPSDAPSLHWTAFLPSLFFIARQSKPRSAKSNSILIPPPSRTGAADAVTNVATVANIANPNFQFTIGNIGYWLLATFPHFIRA